MAAEYHVEDKVFTTYREAAAWALVVAASKGEATLDVICYSEKDAHDYGGDDGVKQYREDPDASVFERYTIRVSCLGMIA